MGQLETDAIGGTWGKATSILSSGVEPKCEIVASLLKPYLTGIDTNGGLMAHYVTKYFNDIYDHAREVANRCRNGARLAYVIGNSKFYGHPLPSDEILANLFPALWLQIGPHRQDGKNVRVRRDCMKLSCS